jgi:hypothetical protein
MPRKFSRQAGPAPHLNAGQLLRAYYGLTQQDLAAFLGVSRATVSLEETPPLSGGMRFLPIGSASKLLPFWQGLPAPEGLAPLPTAPPQADALAGGSTLRQALLRRQADCAYETQRLQRTQQRAQTLLAQARLRLQTLPALLAAAPTGAAGNRQRQWLDYFEQDARATLTDGQAATERVLRELRLEVLAHEAVLLAQRLASSE